jgi:hypothetical protein
VSTPKLSGSFWPTPTQEALLRLVLGGKDRVIGRWQALQPLDIDTLETGSFCLLPLVYQRLSDVSVSDPLLPRLAGTYRNTWYKNQLQLERLSSLVEALGARGIEMIVFGGASLAARSYAHLGCRPSAQLDAMVRPDAASNAREAVLDSGWRAAGTGVAYDRFESEGGIVLVLHAGAPPYLAGPNEPGAALESLRPVAQGRKLGTAAVATLDPADELLFVCGLGARTTVPPSVQWLLDAYHLLLGFGHGRDSGRIVEAARMLRLVRPLRDALAYLDDVSEVLSLDDLLEALAGEPVSRRDLLAYRLAGTRTNRLGGLPQTLALHLRATAADPLSRAIRRLPGHLQTAWGVRDAKRLPIVVLKKAGSRIARPQTAKPNALSRSATRLAETGSTDQPTGAPSVASRKRSASS